MSEDEIYLRTEWARSVADSILKIPSGQWATFLYTASLHLDLAVNKMLIEKLRSDLRPPT